MLYYLKNLSSKRKPWLLLASSAFILELCALYFQHVMKLEPCVMCVYERVAMLGIVSAGLIGFIAPKVWLFRMLAFIVWGASSIWGLLLALEHTGYQFNASPFATCDIFPNFPSWAPLHEWAPWMFNPTGDCSEIVWQFYGYSMPQWLIVSFAIYAGLFAFIFLFSLLPIKKEEFLYY